MQAARMGGRQQMREKAPTWQWCGGRGVCVWLMLGLGWLWVAPATGQPTQKRVIQLDPVVVSATVAPTLLERTSASVTVITREQIEAQQAPNVIDLLRQVPG